MRLFRRKSTPRVVNGKVQRKNHSGRTPTYFNSPLPRLVIDRRRPGAGYRHILNRRDAARFISLLPDWSRLSVGLNAIVLAPGDATCYGWYRRGVVAVCAWDIIFWRRWSPEHYAARRRIMERIGVPTEETADGRRLCKFEPSTIRAFQLFDVLLHELGHHHDLMTTRRQRRSSRGERYAEDYAAKYERAIWDRYTIEFGMP